MNKRVFPMVEAQLERMAHSDGWILQYQEPTDAYEHCPNCKEEDVMDTRTYLQPNTAQTKVWRVCLNCYSVF